MKIQINHTLKKDKHIEYILSKLPSKISHFINQYLKEYPQLKIDEIRLHSNSFMNLITSFKTIRTDLFITEDDILETSSLLCSDSIYSHFDTIKNGYINVGNGIRAGICGKATIQSGQITGIKDFSSINIRMPKRIYHAGDYVFDLFQKNNYKCSVLLYSPPGVGKTTILRELVYRLSTLSNPIRLSVIDSREEILSGLEINASLDLYLSYPKGEAINLATRTMTPELIVCDEITTREEAIAVLNSVNCGVNIIATTHASSFNELNAKEQILPLINNKVFDYAIGISRDIGATRYKFTLNSLKECLV